MTKIYHALIAIVATAGGAAFQAILAEKYNFRGQFHPLLLFIMPFILSISQKNSLLRKAEIFWMLLFLSLLAFCFTAECLGTFS